MYLGWVQDKITKLNTFRRLYHTVLVWLQTNFPYNFIIIIISSSTSSSICVATSIVLDQGCQT